MKGNLDDRGTAFLSSHRFLSILVSTPEQGGSEQQHHRQRIRGPTFTPVNLHASYLVNRFTGSEMMHDLIHLAQKTKRFTVDTQFDHDTGRPSLIQIEFVQEILSIVVLIETCHLPADQESLTFWLIRSLLKFILQPSKLIYVWGRTIDVLLPFVRYGLFTFVQIEELNVDRCSLGIQVLV